MVLPHVAAAEYNLEHGDYWDRDISDIVGLVRQLSFQAIVQAFEQAGCAVIDANLFVRDKAERFAIYAATTLLGNISEEIMKDHQLPATMSVDQEGSLQPQQPSISDLLGEVYRNWRGEDQPSRDWNACSSS